MAGATGDLEAGTDPALTAPRPRAQLRRVHVASVACLASFLVACGATASGQNDADPSAPRDPRASIPGDVQRTVHATLHELPRLCRREPADGRALEQATRSFIRYYARYPNQRFRLQIDDESGTMLSALLVLRQELTRCSVRLTEEVDRTLPAGIRRALRAPGKDAEPPG